MLYVKNVPTWERWARLVLGILAAASVALLSSPWSYAVGATAATLAVTGLIGFCPMCAMIDRRRRT